jgi:DNA end-binding protein Ku
MPITTGILSFGLVSIPVKLHPAIKDHTIRFYLLHKKCGSRIRNQWFCPVCEEAVDRENLDRGFEVSKGKYVQLTDEELESVEAEANRNIELTEFVPLASVDPVYFESSYYLGPDKGAEKPYRLLAAALAQSERAAVAKVVSRGKEQIVIIRPYNKGLLLHGMYFADEVKNFAEVPRAESQRVKQEELKLGAGLIDQMTNDEFDPGKYRDEYRERALELLDEKRKGHEITVPAEPAHKPAAVIDLMEALKRSIGTGARTAATKTAADRAPARKAATATTKAQRARKARAR